MLVRVKLFAHLRTYLPPDRVDGATWLDLPDGATVADAIAALRVPPAYAGMIVCGDGHLEQTSVLRDGQEVEVFPPLVGGA